MDAQRFAHIKGLQNKKVIVAIHTLHLVLVQLLVLVRIHKRRVRHRLGVRRERVLPEGMCGVGIH